MKPLKKLLSILMISAILLPTIGVTSAFAEEDEGILYLLGKCLVECSITTPPWTFARVKCNATCYGEAYEGIVLEIYNGLAQSN